MVSSPVAAAPERSNALPLMACEAQARRPGEVKVLTRGGLGGGEAEK